MTEPKTTACSIAALFQRLTQGVYVVGVAHGAVRNAFTAAWVMQVSFDPLMLTLSISPHHSSPLMAASRRPSPRWTLTFTEGSL